MHLTEKKSLTSGEPNQMKQAAKPLHTHSGAHQCEWGQTGQFGRQKEPSIIGSTSSDRPEPTERWTAHPQMVDVDASQSEGFRRTKSRQYNKDPHVAD